MPLKENPSVIVICGPTGIGKTSLSLSLAQEFNGCIIGADSMQIYRYMDIGTAKPKANELSTAPHYLVDVADPDEDFDAAMYLKEGRKAVSDICSRKMVPFIVGGTGFYLRAILHGLFPVSASDTDIREQLKEELKLKGEDALYNKLCLCDPSAALRIHPNDTYRVIRALEVFQITGQPMSEFQQEHSFSECPYNTLKFCLNMDREKLYDRINSRVEQMIQEGLLEEVKMLLDRGYSEDLKSMQSIGYRHMIEYIKGLFSWDETIYNLKRDTRQYAKRQLTWFRKDKDMIWKTHDEIDEIRALVKDFLADS